ncbi:DUF6247 family protein [Streptomyces sp. NPDC058157]|uniref:DUF6247 family protein n=1 Tax=Streptomyces sp. NPDC058157 TaxID=3346360 RepID=UPI0036E2EC30
MSTAPDPSAATAEDLRATLTRLAPEAVATFDAERAAAVSRSREQLSSTPMRRFLHQWALYVAIERHPTQAARLRALENQAATASSPAQAREIASKIGHILDQAAIEAGIPLGGTR